jgi:hypothetical protein
MVVPRTLPLLLGLKTYGRRVAFTYRSGVTRWELSRGVSGCPYHQIIPKYVYE